jgi:hypothetical protein
MVAHQCYFQYRTNISSCQFLEKIHESGRTIEHFSRARAEGFKVHNDEEARQAVQHGSEKVKPLLYLYKHTPWYPLRVPRDFIKRVLTNLKVLWYPILTRLGTL